MANFGAPCEGLPFLAFKLSQMMASFVGSLVVLAALVTASTTVTETVTVSETTTVQPPPRFRFEPHPRATEGYGTCDLRTSACALASLPRDRSTVVYPGGATRCISTKKTEYGFQVIPGDADKLVVYFQGGGACWDAASAAKAFCVEDAYPGYLSGVFDRRNAKNPYGKHTVVQLLYCSGDAFAADNATQAWTTVHGDVAVQTGQQNVEATLAWIADQNLHLDDLVVAGDSAGSLATMAWANAVLDAFPAKQRSLLFDSYAGIFPKGCQGTVLRDTWPTCTGPLASSLADLGLLDECRAGALDIQAVLAATATRHADAPFAFVQSKADAVQKSFFEAIALSFKIRPYLLSDAAFYERANDVFLGWNALPNVVHFSVDGDTHTFTEDRLLFSADGTGPEGGGAGPSLVDWVRRLEDDGVATTECTGTLEDERHWSGSSYCARSLANKTFPPPPSSGN